MEVTAEGVTIANVLQSITLSFALKDSVKTPLKIFNPKTFLCARFVAYGINDIEI